MHFELTSILLHWHVYTHTHTHTHTHTQARTRTLTLTYTYINPKSHGGCDTLLLWSILIITGVVPGCKWPRWLRLQLSLPRGSLTAELWSWLKVPTFERRYWVKMLHVNTLYFVWIDKCVCSFFAFLFIFGIWFVLFILLLFLVLFLFGVHWWCTWVAMAVSWGNCSVLCRMYERGKEVEREWLCQPGLSRAPRLG